ncbi:helix-turn-helix domain-containing protein [Actinokineospora iranica]|uniref:Helix-turn-helix domain-containing protein n=1 Tax=Actinokineospora iranica TaxID=1271860 RepID=A0A1G6TLG8_9PSEU|nr:helix-turn-helix transcriptional regulator [Actinokineospora iranica]SDD29891.1 Helix-turn-helix domain-containing protein [Actinokineospora iranica]
MDGEGTMSMSEQLARTLGEELRRARAAAGWTRAELVAVLEDAIQTQTLSTYELGQRNCTVVRFVEICRALRVSAPELLTRALQRAAIDLENLVLQVDLRSVVEDRQAELRPLRRWARYRLDNDTTGTGIALLDFAVIKEMSAFCALSQGDMARRLAAFAPE